MCIKERRRRRSRPRKLLLRKRALIIWRRRIRGTNQKKTSLRRRPRWSSLLGNNKNRAWNSSKTKCRWWPKMRALRTTSRTTTPPRSSLTTRDSPISKQTMRIKKKCLESKCTNPKRMKMIEVNYHSRNRWRKALILTLTKAAERKLKLNSNRSNPTSRTSKINKNNINLRTRAMARTAPVRNNHNQTTPKTSIDWLQFLLNSKIINRIAHPTAFLNSEVSTRSTKTRSTGAPVEVKRFWAKTWHQVAESKVLSAMLAHLLEGSEMTKRRELVSPREIERLYP